MYWRWHLPEKEHVSLFFLDLITLELVYIAWPNTTFNWANSSFVSTIKVNLSIARNHRQSNGEITPPVACSSAPASENHHTLSTWGLLIIHWLPDFTEPISMSVTVCVLMFFVYLKLMGSQNSSWFPIKTNTKQWDTLVLRIARGSPDFET